MTKWFTKDSLIFPCGMSLRELEALPTNTFGKRDIVLEILYHDRIAFNAYFFQDPTDEGRKGLIDIKYGIPDFHIDIVDNCLKKMNSENDCAVVIVPRGFSKTALVTKCDTMHGLLFQEFENTMLVGENKEKAEEYLGFIIDELELNTRIKLFFGDLKPVRSYDGSSKSWTMSKIVTKLRQCVYAVGMRGGKIRGNNFLTVRPQRIIVDDAESKQTIRTPMQMRKTVNLLFDEILLALSDDGYLIVLGNYLIPGCLVDKLYRNPEWTKIKYSAMDKDLKKSLWELKKPAHKLLKRKRNMEAVGNYEGFWLELMNDPKRASSKRFDPDDYMFWIGLDYSREAQYITVDRIGRYFPNSVEIDWRKMQGKQIPVDFYMGIDLAFTEKQINDFNAFCIWAADKDFNVYDIEHIAMKTNRPSDVINMIINKDNEYNFKNIAIEANGAQVVVYNNLKEECQRLGLRNLERKIIPITVQMDNKLSRILGTLQPKTKRNKLYFRYKMSDDGFMPCNPEHIRQYDELSPNIDHDDLIDADEMCISNMRAANKHKGVHAVKNYRTKSKLEIYEETCGERWKLV